MHIIQNRIKARKAIKEPCIGDYVKLKNGTLEQITVLYDDRGQAGGPGSIYMAKSGHGSYSGSCGKLFKLSELKPTIQRKKAQFWFFSQDWSGGNRGIYFDCPVKIWKLNSFIN